jgi:high-affinity iron transporter
MLATLLIVFREVVEAGLIVGIVLAATVCVPSRGLWVSLGVIGGVIGAALVAVFAGGIAALFQGSGQELFNAAILILAVVMLTWHNVWMANHGKEMSRELKAIGAQVKTGGRSLLALAVVVGVAVLREGSEVTLFLYGVAAGGGASAVGMMTGGLLPWPLGDPGAPAVRGHYRPDHPACRRPRGAGRRLPTKGGRDQCSADAALGHLGRLA